MCLVCRNSSEQNGGPKSLIETGKPTTNVALVCGLSKVLWRSMLSGNRLSWLGSAGPFGCAQPREVSSDRGLPRHLAGDMPW